MLCIDFIATRNDLLPIFRQIESRLECQYTPYACATSQPPIYYSVEEIPEREFVQHGFHISQRGVALDVVRSDDVDAPASELFIVETPDDISVSFYSGGMGDDGRIKLGDIALDVTFSGDEYAFYREIARPLREGLRRVNNDLYIGNEALFLGANGVEFDCSGAFVPQGDYPYIEAQLSKQVDRPAQTERLSLDATWDYLESIGIEPPRDAQGLPCVVTDNPYNHSYDDRLTFFRTYIRDLDFSCLTMPNSFFGRTQIDAFNFRNTDLSGSYMQENDWLDCDFTSANLSKCSLIALFYNCNFNGADLRGADLRDGGFYNCDFTNAILADACLRPEQAQDLPLSELQRLVINWQCPDESDEDEDEEDEA